MTEALQNGGSCNCRVEEGTSDNILRLTMELESFIHNAQPTHQQQPTSVRPYIRELKDILLRYCHIDEDCVKQSEGG